MTAKPWQDRPLWERVWLGPHSDIYQSAGEIIGYKGCTLAEFEAAASKLPDYKQFLFENVANDLTVFKTRQEGRYELHPTARKVLRVILGPPPDDPEYREWWRKRLISLADMRERGLTPQGPTEPPVPLDSPKQEPPREEPAPEEPKKRTKRKKAAG